MKTKLLLMGFILLIEIAHAQQAENYKQSASEENANYYEIVSQARAEFNEKDLTLIKNKKAKKQFERWAFYWKNRVHPDGTFPNENSDYFNAGILDANGAIVSNTPVGNANRMSAENWSNIGPSQSDMNNNGYVSYPQMGRLNAFLRIKHPSDPNQDVLFVGAPNGGIWKSTDGGNSWQPKLDMVSGIGVTDIETVPGTTTANYLTQPIYVSTGDYDAGHVNAIGVLKSTDGGETFASTGLTYNLSEQNSLGDLIVIDANTVFVGGQDNIQKTTDGGTNWSDAFNSGYSSVKFGRAASSGTRMMFSDAFGGIAYTSDYTNNSNWSYVVNPDDYNKTAVTVGDDGNFYIQNMAGQIKVFNSTNQTFSNVGNIPTGYNSQYGYNQALIVTNDIMITGEFNGQSSTDGGNNWTRTLNGYWEDASSPGTFIHSDHHRMGRLDGNLEFWSVNDGGMGYITYSSTTDITPAITYKSGSVIVTQLYSVAINPNASDGAIVMANQDNDAFSKYNGTWYAVATGDGIQSAINYNSPNIRYAANQNGYIMMTDTGFQGQLQGNGNYVQVPGANFYFPLEMHKTNPEVLYAGGNNDVHKITVSGSSSMNISATNSGLTGTIVSIATHGNSVIASDGSAIKYSADQGTTWSTVSLPSGATGNITSLDYDATNPSIIYATYSGYNNGVKVFKTSNGGTSWSNISGNLPNIVVNEIMLKQAQPSEFLFLATGLGVYQSSNGGSYWQRLGQGLPYVDVKDLEINYTEDKLVAATFGRGLWNLSIVNSSLGIATTETNTEEVSLYPNPATDLLHIETPAGEYNYTIYNVVGGIVKSGTLSNELINLSGIKPNVYLIRVYNGTYSSTKKFIINAK